MTVAENARTVGDWNHDGDRDCAYTFCTHAIISHSRCYYGTVFLYELSRRQLATHQLKEIV